MMIKLELEYYCTANDCVVALKQLNYVYQLHSTNQLEDCLANSTIDGHNINSKSEDRRNYH